MIAKNTTASALKIIPLGGLHEIGKNTCVFEYGDEIILLDAVVFFAIMRWLVIFVTCLLSLVFRLLFVARAIIFQIFMENSPGGFTIPYSQLSFAFSL